MSFRKNISVDTNSIDDIKPIPPGTPSPSNYNRLRPLSASSASPNGTPPTPRRTGTPRRRLAEALQQDAMLSPIASSLPQENLLCQGGKKIGGKYMLVSVFWIAPRVRFRAYVQETGVSYELSITSIEMMELEGRKEEQVRFGRSLLSRLTFNESGALLIREVVKEDGQDEKKQ